jgi:signal transduction histidine kinase
LTVIGIAKPRCSGPFLKEPDELWLDVPLLLSSGKAFGKITLQVDQEYSPERFELLSMYCIVVSGILDAFLRRRNAQDEAAAAERKALADISHNLASRFASLSGYIDLYEYHEKRYPLLAKTNRQFEQHYGEIVEVVNRAKHRLGGINLCFSEFDIAEAVRDSVGTLPEPTRLLSLPETGCAVSADKTLLTGCFAELIQNAKESVGDVKALRLTVKVSIRGSPAFSEHLKAGKSLKLDVSRKRPIASGSYRPLFSECDAFVAPERRAWGPNAVPRLLATFCRVI